LAAKKIGFIFTILFTHALSFFEDLFPMHQTAQSTPIELFVFLSGLKTDNFFKVGSFKAKARP